MKYKLLLLILVILYIPIMIMEKHSINHTPVWYFIWLGKSVLNGSLGVCFLKIKDSKINKFLFWLFVLAASFDLFVVLSSLI